MIAATRTDSSHRGGFFMLARRIAPAQFGGFFQPQLADFSTTSAHSGKGRCCSMIVHARSGACTRSSKKCSISTVMSASPMRRLGTGPSYFLSIHHRLCVALPSRASMASYRSAKWNSGTFFPAHENPGGFMALCTVRSRSFDFTSGSFRKRGCVSSGGFILKTMDWLGTG